jgi:hypothetical protein
MNSKASRHHHCPACGHARGPSPPPICPECGAPFDEALARANLRMRRRIVMLRIVAVLIAIYAPYCWLLTMDYPWSSHRWTFIKMWPILPGLLPATLIMRMNSGMMIVAILTIVMILAAMTWAACRGWRLFLVVLTALLAISILESWCVYHLFRA